MIVENVNRNIIVLSNMDCTPELNNTAIFCLKVAKQTDIPIHEIWVLGEGHQIDQAIHDWFANITIKYIKVDESIWPLDVGNNQYLQLPLTLYSHLRTTPVDTILSPLKGGAPYFALMARAGGLANHKDCKIITTCYMPYSLEVEGSLILPTHLENVVDTELETKCASMSDELWISHDCLRDSISKALSLSNREHIKVVKTEKSETPKPAKRHVIFAGPLNPLYGFDAFCNLLELMADEIEEATIFAPKPYKANQIPKYVTKLPIKLNVVIGNPKGGTLSDGVLISPMRAPVLPNAVQSALAAGIKCIWGTGFTLPRSDTNMLLYPTISDVRKLSLVLKNVWGLDQQNNKETPQEIAETHHASFTAKQSNDLSPIKSISVILLHHNRLLFLQDALKSLEDQTLTDFEVIIVDDGSDDILTQAIRDIVKQSKLKNIKISFITNSYPSVARNHGVKLASGDALFFLDDDNRLDPNTLLHMKTAIQAQDIILSFFQTFSTSDTKMQVKRLHNELNIIGPTFSFAGLLPGTGLFYNLLGNASMMIRKKTFINLGGFSSKYGVGLEDYAFLLKAALERNINYVVLPEPYLHFRMHPNKIRNTHVDWRSDTRLQAGHWRLINDMGQSTSGLPRMALGYARQLHEIAQYQYVSPKRPKYFRIKSVLIHQYIRPLLSKQLWLRRSVTKFTSGESRLAKRIEKWFF